MPVAEIGAAVSGIKATLDIVKAMTGLRDAEAFRSKSIELQTSILDSLDQAIAAREAYSEQLERVRILEAEVSALKDWGKERDKYEMKSVGQGSTVYMLKPEARNGEPPHWLCPNCFARGKKSFFSGTGTMVLRRWSYVCADCKTSIAAEESPTKWLDEAS
jgi:hypothetical protein